MKNSNAISVFYRVAQRYIPDDSRRCENSKSSNLQLETETALSNRNSGFVEIVSLSSHNMSEPSGPTLSHLIMGCVAYNHQRSFALCASTCLTMPETLCITNPFEPVTNTDIIW
jgi:hypothetical protein